MIFDESFFQLTGGKLNHEDEEISIDDLDDLLLTAEENAKRKKSEVEDQIEEQTDEQFVDLDAFPADLEIGGSRPDSLDDNPVDSYASSRDYVIESDLVVPTIKRQKVKREKPIVLVIDDDFDMLDLLKIYLMRDYEYKPFSGPKEAIFYLNENVPDLIFIDCYIHSIKAARVVDIIHSYKEIADIPIYYICEEYERGAIERKLPEGVKGIIERPIARGKLQEILDVVFPEKSRAHKEQALKEQAQ